MKLYEYIEDFKVKCNESDFKDELKISSVLSYFEEVASGSASELGFGYEYLKPKGFTFMVSGICCDFIRPIKFGELLTVKTWPLPPSYAAFGREYQILNKEGEVLLNGTSRWCLVDLSTGKILSSKVIEGQDYTTYNTNRALDFNHWKLPKFSIGEGEFKYALRILNSEYDHNLHVNNTRYADYCLNCFSLEELSIMRLKRFCVSYHKQCFEGDELRLYRKRMSENSYLVQGYKNNDELVISCELVFLEDV